MKPPCESISKKAIPTLRAILVKKLHQKHNLTQTEIAEKLGITQPAVSQYLKSIRGNENLEIKLKNGKIYEKIESFAKKIKENHLSKEEKIKKFCEICKSIREKGLIQQSAKMASDNINNTDE